MEVFLSLFSDKKYNEKKAQKKYLLIKLKFNFIFLIKFPPKCSLKYFFIINALASIKPVNNKMD
jgi:hypothetical protein